MAGLHCCVPYALSTPPPSSRDSRRRVPCTAPASRRWNGRGAQTHAPPPLAEWPSCLLQRCGCGGMLCWGPVWAQSDLNTNDVSIVIFQITIFSTIYPDVQSMTLEYRCSTAILSKRQFQYFKGIDTDWTKALHFWGCFLESQEQNMWQVPLPPCNI